MPDLTREDLDALRERARLALPGEAVTIRAETLRALVAEGPSHLWWNGSEWQDDRCECRYHPDDPNGTHGGGPHVHNEKCPKHAPDHR